MPPPTATHLFFSSEQSTNVSQALSENKAIRKPVLALEQSTRKKKKKTKKKKTSKIIESKIIH